jgi:site-specific DNA-methyltransferase (adenine-specific)
MGLLTTKEAAEILGVSRVRVRQWIGENRLQAEKLGRDHLIEPAEIQRFRKSGRLSGPKGGRPKARSGR